MTSENVTAIRPPRAPELGVALIGILDNLDDIRAVISTVCCAAKGIQGDHWPELERTLRLHADDALLSERDRLDRLARKSRAATEEVRS